MKKQRDHYAFVHEFAKKNPDVPLFIIPKTAMDKRRYLEFMRFLFKEDIKCVDMRPGVGCFTTKDRDTINDWFNENMFMSDVETFPSFRKMHNDIRDTGLRIAKFDIFYGFKEQGQAGFTDEYVNFYCNVINSMSARFYGVQQFNDTAEFLGPKDVWVFYFEDENDHLVFSNLVDMEIEAKSNTGFRAPPSPDRVISLDISTTGTMLTSISSVLQFTNPPKFKVTGKVTNNPDGTVTIEEV